MITFTALDERLQGRCKVRRKLENNTYAERRDLPTKQAIAIRLHETDILTFWQGGYITVDSGGWRTVTTRDRLNKYLPAGVRIYSDKGIWYWYVDGIQIAPFTDKDGVTPGLKIEAQRRLSDAKEEQKRRKAIRKYADRCAAALPLEEPGNGDCFYCHLVTTEGKPLGDANGDVSHLTSHIEEGYFVPSLVYHALKASGTGDLIISAAFGKAGDHWTETARDYVRRAVRRYMYRAFSLTA